MKMGLIQADTVSRLICLALWSKDSNMRFNPKVNFEEDLFHVGHVVELLQKITFGRRRITSTMPQLFSDYFAATGRGISVSMVRRHLYNEGMYARKPFVCIPLNKR
ncbi:hypothetical protein AVEN_231868-1 [Araneus ventricosus]|uniref:Transposase Tc1-like domain-containing protein n=1 Tax=Araneus ventricosus TaxID=182803 RepID=A0A4Y2U8H5_ARAVE|nr:hypothetical protein AVEN_231868-1 [Araneus ventricosus]